MSSPLSLFQGSDTSAISNLFLMSVLLKPHTHTHLSTVTLHDALLTNVTNTNPCGHNVHSKHLHTNTLWTQSPLVTSICDMQNSAKKCTRQRGEPGEVSIPAAHSCCFQSINTHTHTYSSSPSAKVHGVPHYNHQPCSVSSGSSVRPRSLLTSFRCKTSKQKLS